ncbi:MAG: hypothetical protein ACKO92_06290, partial [Actinomycetota bacterium]
AYEYVSRLNRVGLSGSSGKVSVIKEVLSPMRSVELAEYRKVINHGLPKPTRSSKLEVILAKLSPRPKVVLAGVVQKKLALVAMHLRLGMLPRLWRFNAKLSAHDVDLNLRAEFMGSRRNPGSFQDFLHQAIGRHIPSIYLEGYKELVAVATQHNQLASAPKAIFTNTLLARSEQFKVWCATFAAQHGTKLFSGQHGGGYSVSRFSNWTEAYEQSVDDLFLAWGSVSNSKFDSPSCVQARRFKFRSDSSGKLLIVLGPVTRQQNNFNLGNVHSNSSYYGFLSEFVSLIDARHHRSVIVRPKAASSVNKPARVSIDQVATLIGHQIQIDDCRASLETELMKCRLAVVTYNETT